MDMDPEKPLTTVLLVHWKRAQNTLSRSAPTEVCGYAALYGAPCR